jgi:uncharacterized phosphosugar-binding protein
MRAQIRYIQNLERLLAHLKQNPEEIEKTAQLMAVCLENDGLIHVFGTGHSHMLAEEMFYRAGGLGAVNPILEEDLMLHKNASRSTELERDPTHAKEILEKHNLRSGDVFIIASNSGGNALVEAIANEVKQRGLTLVAITSLRHAKSSAARAQGRKLHELADVTIDNLGEVGDASISYAEIQEKTGPTSTVIGATIVNALVARAVEIVLEHGFKPKIFSSSNTTSGDVHNTALIASLKERVVIL